MADDDGRPKYGQMHITCGCDGCKRSKSPEVTLRAALAVIQEVRRFDSRPTEELPVEAVLGIILMIDRTREKAFTEERDKFFDKCPNGSRSE